METPDLDICRILAVKHGLPLQFIVKDFYLMDVLSQLAACQNDIGNPVFKGGTALNKVYLGGMQRFSEDLDFDVETDSSDVRAVCKNMAEMLSGYKISEIRKVGATYQFECGFSSQLGGSDHIRVDVAAKKINTFAKPMPVQAVSPFCQKSVAGVLAYGLDDLVARKMAALVGRDEGKDVYDIHLALPICKNMDRALLAMLKSEGRIETPHEFIGLALEKTRKLDVKKAGKITNPFIPYPNRPKNWQVLKNDILMMLEALYA